MTLVVWFVKQNNISLRLYNMTKSRGKHLVRLLNPNGYIACFSQLEQFCLWRDVIDN